jgi:hypothetical protein
VLSRKSIYKAEVEKEGEGVAQARVKNFTLVHSNEAGLENVWYIFSHNATDFENASMGAYEVAYWAGPVSGSSLPFSHLYEVNHSYGEEWGQHLMGIRVYDFYGGEYEYSKEALGRKVTKEGVSETGEEGEDPLYYRPGIESGGEAGLTRFTIPASTTLVVFMVFSLWAYAYYRRERGKRRA